MTEKKHARDCDGARKVSHQSQINKGREPLKRLMNAAEAKAEVLLEGAAARHGVRVYPKQRLADVCAIEGSGISDSDYSYALKAHLDFVIATPDRHPLFAVEIDGPGHDPRNDATKNRLCDRFGLPLARVRERHLHAQSRGLDMLTWLSEIFFTFRAMEEAQLAGDFPEDEPIDVMSVYSAPDLPGKFPLCFSMQTHAQLRSLHEAGRLRSCVPFRFVVHRANNGGTVAFVTLEVMPQRWVISTESIFLSGFGMADFEAAEELASLSLRRIVEAHLVGEDVTVRASVVREKIHQLMRQGEIGSSGGGSVSGQYNFGFAYHQRNGEMKITVTGPEDEPH